MQDTANLEVKIEIEKVRATPSEGVTLDQLIDIMEEIGNKVLEVNREGNYLLLEHS